MNDQQKIYRVFRLLQLLELGIPINQLQDKLGVSERTVFRYFATLKSLGFEIENNLGVFRVKKKANLPFDFSLDEVHLILDLIHSLPSQNRLKKVLKEKLGAYSSNYTPTQYFKLKMSIVINTIQESIDCGNRVSLVNYKSASGNSILTRLVEPLNFSDDFAFLYAIDCKDRKWKVFKLDRIGEAKMSSQKCQITQFKADEIDVFGMTGKESTHITLKMNLRSKLLLEEEFPNSTSDIKQENGNYYLKTQVYGYKGAARFVLGLLDEVEVIEPIDFKNYLNEKVMKRGF